MDDPDEAAVVALWGAVGLVLMAWVAPVTDWGIFYLLGAPCLGRAIYLYGRAALWWD